MVAELAWLAVSVMVAGVVTGFLAGLFGIGGGAVIVPVLFEVFRILGVPETVRHAALHRHLARHHRTNSHTLLSRAQAPRSLVLADVLRRWTLPSHGGRRRRFRVGGRRAPRCFSRRHSC